MKIPYRQPKRFFGYYEQLGVSPRTFKRAITPLKTDFKDSSEANNLVISNSYSKDLQSFRYQELKFSEIIPKNNFFSNVNTRYSRTLLKS